MPLLRKQPFHRQQPPAGLKPDDEVFHCKLTNEVFKDYEEFFERIILCNSLVWSCSITGKAGLTYQEAVESEEKALKNIASFPVALQKPLLFLAEKTKRGRLADLNDDVFMFAKDRYFIGEIVDAVIAGEKKCCKVLRVIPPAPSDDGSCIVIDSDEEDTSNKAKSSAVPKSDEYKYVVQEVDKSNITITIPAKQVSRKKGLYTRDKSKLFLKNNSDIEDGVWKIKENVLKKKGIENMQFIDFYAGPVPVFEVTESKKKTTKKKNSIDPSENANSSKKKKDKKDKVAEKEKSKPKPVFIEEDLTPEEKAALKEQQKQQKIAEKNAQKEELKRKWEEEKQKKKEEKAKEIEKRREEKRIQAEQLKEWSRIRDDLECDDLKVLPEPTPVKTKIPQGLFGDCVMVLEFVNIFKSLFDLRAYFPKGFTFDVLEEALMETDHNGTLTDILLMLMTAVFSLQEQEEAEEEELSKQDEAVSGVFDNETDVQDTDQLMEMATVCSLTPMLTHGLLLKKLPLDSFTLSEIIRLHLLSSGAKVSDKNVKYRFQERGGYTSLDDPGLEFRKQETALLKNLSTNSIFDLSPSDRLKIISVLIQQFMTYAAARDIIEDSGEKLRSLRMDLKQLQWAEQRREREDATARWKKKMEEKARDREKREEWRQECLKEQEKRNNMRDNGQDITHLPPINWMYKSDEPELSLEEKEEIQRKEEEQESDKKAQFALSEKKVIEQLAKIQQTCSIIPIGRDRMYRRYWIFSSVHGLYIEDDEIHVDTTQLLPLSTNKSTNNKSKDENGSDKENDSVNSPNKSHVNGPKSVSSENSEEVICLDDQSRIPSEKMEVDVHTSLPENEVTRQIVGRQKNLWGFISTEEEFDHLLNSLNGRGYRESALRAALVEQRSRVVESIDKCPVDMIFKDTEETDQINEDSNDSSKKAKSVVKRTSKGLIKSDSAQEVLEINLRELLLDLEERVYIGALGSLKVNNRHVWRDALEKGSFDPQSDDPVYAKFQIIKKDESEEDDASSVCSGDATESIVKDLSKALLQIQHGIESKYLVMPLGEVDAKQKKTIAELKKEKEEQIKKKEEEDGDVEEEKVPQKTTLERWQDSLLCCTSLSQVFLHLGTLEKSIAWSKSALHARCRVCRRKGNAEQMLLCDLCDRGHHMYCLKPALKVVPTGDWFCPDCRPKEIKRSPLKGRRKTFIEESEEERESSDEDEEDSSEDEEEESEEEDSEADAECAVCNKGGMLVCCDACPLSYHVDCAVPPLKKVPRGKWLCQICLGTATSGKIKLPKHIKGKQKSTPKSTPSSSRKTSPRESPITVQTKGRKRPLVEMEENGPKLKRAGRSTSKLPNAVNGDFDHGYKSVTSSSRGSNKVHQLRQCEEVVHDLVKHDDSWPFMKPVSKKQVPDYHQIISRPMDFSTIRTKINNYGYSELPDLVGDVRQVFLNCFEYNKKTSVEFKCGLTLSKVFEKRLKDLGIDVPEQSGPASKRSRRTL